MFRTLMAALAAFVLVAAVPALACDGDCAKKKDKVAQAEKKGDKDATVACPCAGGKECKCAEGCKCECSHCHERLEKKDETKKT
jgi:hypothetical protein